MASDKTDKGELWVDWTRDAMANFPTPEEVGDGDDAAEDLAIEMADVACHYADEMLEEYERRFGKGAGNGKGRRRRKKDDDEEER